MKDLLKIIQQQSATIDSLTNELTLLREQVAYLTQKLYGKSSEKSRLVRNLVHFIIDDGTN
ncbi:hypothetical protein [Streptococcus pneumoniae]|uniref:hypothetical protein n=1 Tax=Streptococcus pneumoniae TaxID=1313 RepID=UPI0005E973AB|nr:hypothetical protein [Streptococcus pneumoniae]CJZ97883.1 putative transposase remnant (pseudogene) [Streptococcus pneumoniae]CKA13836.1 putative transposase remnant (pseudogene) [Streptococcus pneumoniae]